MVLKILSTPLELKNWRSELAGTLGFVPTMGALHQGHLDLVARSKQDCDNTLVSIFVNPTQFDNASDLESYPITLEQDFAHLAELEVEAVFAPKIGHMYPDGKDFWVEENSQSKILEGAFRMGHFRGMLTVVMKLLNLAQANRAFFGEKDFQQLQLVKGMAKNFFIPTEIIGCPTTRESDGLAMSSRNRRLNSEQRKLAPALFREISKNQSLAQAQKSLEELGFKVEYIEDWLDRRLVAAQLGDVRLIDNVKKPAI